MTIQANSDRFSHHKCNHELSSKKLFKRVDNPMIFYEQSDDRIAFLLDESVCREISSWNCEHLNSELGRAVKPFFQITLPKDESNAMCIEVEQMWEHLTFANIV
jgi:hypothetical protein